MPKRPPPTNDNAIQMFVHCGLCLDEWKAKELPATRDQSPRSYARLEIGYTDVGYQVWCVRHECNVMHVDFEGQRHPANTSRRRRPDELQEGEAMMSSPPAENSEKH